MKGFIHTFIFIVTLSLGLIPVSQANPNHKDLFRLALPFDEARPWFTKGNVIFDQFGWPKNLNGGKAGTRFLSHMPMAALPRGDYTVLYEGEGKLRYGASARVVSQSPGWHKSQNQIRIIH